MLGHGLQQENTKNAPHCTALNASDPSSRPKKITIFVKIKLGERDIRDDEIGEDVQEEDSTHDEKNQDNSISFDDDEDSKACQEDDSEY